MFRRGLSAPSVRSQWLNTSFATRHYTSKTSYTAPLIQIHDGTFYRSHPNTPPAKGAPPNPPLFPNLSLYLPSFSTPNQTWAVLSPSSNVRTTFLQVLRGQLICDPPTSRTFPYLIEPETQQLRRAPEHAIQYVGFDAERTDMGGAYLSARYESRVEETDFTLERYLTGILGLNPGEDYVREHTPEKGAMLKVVDDLELAHLFEKPVSTLSNGQSRRARIGKALLKKPEMLLLDSPFIGLDPYVTEHISSVLHRFAESNSPRILISLRPQDPIPEWVTHILYVGEDSVVKCQGPKLEVFKFLQEQFKAAEVVSLRLRSAQEGTEWGPESDGVEGKVDGLSADQLEMRDVGRQLAEHGHFELEDPASQGRELSRDAFPATEAPIPLGEPLIEMEGVNIKYGKTSVLGDWLQTVPSSDGNSTSSKPGLWWTIRRGQRWGIFGANGSGKTTVLSVITSDHPQTYAAPVKIFGRSRLPSPGQPGISIFDLQARMGHASPEVHALFPKRLTVRRVLESVWADTPIMPPRLNEERTSRVEAALRWFRPELDPSFNPSTSAHEDTDDGLSWATQSTFHELSFSSQRVILFLRAIIHQPDILILDEAFSGMDDIVRDKCLLFLSKGETMTLQYSPTTPYPTPVESDAAKKGNVKIEGLSDNQALLCVSHTKEDVPGCVREWICLQEPGRGEPRFGRLEGPVEMNNKRWGHIWGTSQ